MAVKVIDTGIGIDPSDKKRLFKQFGKLEAKGEMNKEGIGLGLMISKTLVEAYDGTMDVHSDGVGKGTTFSFNMAMEFDAPINYIESISDTDANYAANFGKDKEVGESVGECSNNSSSDKQSNKDDWIHIDESQFESIR